MSSLETSRVASQVEQLQSYENVLVVALNGPNKHSEFGVQLSQDTVARNAHAGALAIVGGYDVLCVGGDAGVNRRWMMEHFGYQLGRVNIHVDSSSRDTVGNAINTSRFMTDAGIDAVGLVTLPYHMRRAAYCFDKVLDPAVTVVETGPVDTVHGLAKKAYLRAAQEPISLLNHWQLRGFEPTDEDALEMLEARLASHNPRYEETESRRGAVSRMLGWLDRATSARR